MSWEEQAAVTSTNALSVSKQPGVFGAAMRCVLSSPYKCIVVKHLQDGAYIYRPTVYIAYTVVILGVFHLIF